MPLNLSQSKGSKFSSTENLHSFSFWILSLDWNQAFSQDLKSVRPKCAIYRACSNEQFTRQNEKIKTEFSVN